MNSQNRPWLLPAVVLCSCRCHTLDWCNWALHTGKVVAKTFPYARRAALPGTLQRRFHMKSQNKRKAKSLRQQGRSLLVTCDRHSHDDALSPQGPTATYPWHQRVLEYLSVLERHYTAATFIFSTMLCVSDPHPSPSLTALPLTPEIKGAESHSQ